LRDAAKKQEKKQKKSYEMVKNFSAWRRFCLKWVFVALGVLSRSHSYGAVDEWIGSEFAIRLGVQTHSTAALSSATLDKLFTHMCLCHQAI